MGVLASVLVLGGGAWLWPKVLAGRPTGTDTAPADGRWQPWSESKVRELKAQGRAVFVDFSAQWCWTCKVNENGVLASSPVLEAFRKGKVALLRADWTRQDPAITEALKAHGRSGVPLYLYYPVQGEPQVLPEVLTQGTVLRALEKP
jgi:thiol:disulfide interchange protein DsbD